MIALRYPRHKLADDGTNFARGQAVATPGLIRAEIVARAIQWESAGLTDAVVVFECDTGQRYVINDAFTTDTPTLKDGEGGNVTLKMEGPGAEEVL